MVLMCVATILMNISGIPYTSQDFKAIARTQVVCRDKYKGCLRQFQKREVGVYRVLCGDQQEFDRKVLDKYESDIILEELKQQGGN